MSPQTSSRLDEIVARALAEDIGPGDLTSEGLFSPDERCTADLVVKQPGVVCGLRAAEAVFRALDHEVEVEVLLDDGTQVTSPPAVLARVSGPSRAVLGAERTALNLLGRLSGIATLTRRYVDAVEGTGAVVLDTRKTTPGIRELEKDAVRCGGGTNHRLGLFDAILVKDNHLRLAGGITSAVDRLRAAAPRRPIEVEVETLDQLDEALEAGADRILLDNMPPAVMREAVRHRDARNAQVPLEASGGITLDTVRAVAATGVDFVSVGALTHSARSLDVSMEVRS
ncbi:MAG: carboxylating nicotinate-nucleotide diphosphorylase [Gaiellales bacterium]